MRLDKFLNATNLTKRRAVARDMCDSGVVLVNGVISKPSKEVRIDDLITLRFLESSATYKVLKLPMLKNIPKSQRDEYVKKLE